MKIGWNLSSKSETSIKSSRKILQKKDNTNNYEYSLLGLARWETDHIVEWIEYNKYIGFDHIFLYCNDDDPMDLYTQVAAYVGGRAPFVTFVHYPFQGYQWWMWMHFFKKYASLTKWLAIFDVDEFLNLPKHCNIASLMADMPSDADCIYFNWAYFGNSGRQQRKVDSVIRNYTRRQGGIDPNTKSITRVKSIKMDMLSPDVRYKPGFVYPNHGWNKLTASGMKIYDVLGNRQDDYYDSFPEGFNRLISVPGNVEKVYDTAILHHYAFKAEADFQRRLDRGLGGSHSAQVTWKNAMEQGNHLRFLSDINAIEDKSLKNRWESFLSSKVDSLGVFPKAIGDLQSKGCVADQSSIAVEEKNSTTAGAASRGCNGLYNGSCNVQTKVEDTPWWMVELKEVTSITEIRVFNVVDDISLSKHLKNFIIDLSDDGKIWRLGIECRSSAPVGGIDGSPFIWRPSPIVTAKYVRVRVLGSGALVLDQIEVYGHSVEQAPRL